MYASTTYLLRRTLWNDINDLQNRNPDPWCLIGDFNAVLGSLEVRGFITRGSEYNWSIGRRGAALTEKRLDRCMCNVDWLNFWTISSCCTLFRSKSDHFPILLDVRKGVNSFPSSFKFHKMWISHPDCKRLIKEVWSKPVFGCPMFILSQKLKQVKAELKVWNLRVFGNIQLRVNNAIEAVNKIQLEINALGASDDLIQQETLAQVELQQALNYI